MPSVEPPSVKGTVLVANASRTPGSDRSAARSPCMTRRLIRRIADPLIADHHHIGLVVDAGRPFARGHALLDDEQGIAEYRQRDGHLHGDQDGADFIAAHG